MNYTNSNAGLERLLKRQVAGVAGRIPLYSGLGSWRHSGPERTAEQIDLTRRLGADGFVCFAHTPLFAETFLPALALGTTRLPAGLLPHHAIQLAFETVPKGRKRLDGAFRIGDSVTVVVAEPENAAVFQPMISLERDGYACGDEAGSLAVRRERRSVRCRFTPRKPGLYRVVVRGEWTAADAGRPQPLLDRGPLIEVLDEKAAAERELRNGPPRFTGRGIRVGVWQHAGYGAGPILDALAAEKGIAAAPLYNLHPDSLAACDVVVLTQPREKVALFRDGKIMAAVTAYIRNGGGVLTTHALVGIRGFVNGAPEVAAGGDRLPGRTWQAVGRHALTRGLANAVHQATFNDRIEVEPEQRGTVVAQTPEGRPVVVAGTLGKGRYVACGLGLGIAAGDRDGPLSEPEKRLLCNAVRWLSKD
jgi:hypothetical protein